MQEIEDKYYKAGQILQSTESDTKYQVIKSLGQGTYGQVYKVKDLQSGEIFAAKADWESRYLVLEHHNLQQLHSTQHVPNVHGEVTQVSFENQNRYIMKMDVLGQDLMVVHEKQKKSKVIFNLQACCNLGKQMVNIIKDVHKSGLIHRDIKPANFCISKDGSVENLATGLEPIHLIDFGLTKSYLGRHNKHIPMLMDQEMTGTPRYASFATHLGYEQARRDDIEVIGNTLIYLYKGSLPWEDYYVGANRYEKYLNIANKVKSTTLQEVCDGCPIQFYKFMEYSRKLQFEEEPDYQYLIDLLEECREANESNGTTLLVNMESTQDEQSVCPSSEAMSESTKASQKAPSVRKQIKKRKQRIVKKIKQFKKLPLTHQAQTRTPYFLRRPCRLARKSNKASVIPLRFQSLRDFYEYHTDKLQNEFFLGFLDN